LGSSSAAATPHPRGRPNAKDPQASDGGIAIGEPGFRCCRPRRCRTGDCAGIWPTRSVPSIRRTARRGRRGLPYQRLISGRPYDHQLRWRSVGFVSMDRCNDLDHGGARSLEKSEAMRYPEIVLARDIPSGSGLQNPPRPSCNSLSTTFRPSPLAPKPGATAFQPLLGCNRYGVFCFAGGVCACGGAQVLRPVFG